MTPDATRVALTGHGPLTQRLRARISRSPLAIEVVDEGRHSGLAIHEKVAPSGSYLGVATADRPGELFLADDAALGYVVATIEYLAMSGARSVAIRRPIEDEWVMRRSPRELRRRLRRFRPDDYDWPGAPSIDDEVFDGEAVLSGDGGDEIVTRVRIVGHVNPLDGRYHWAGTVFGEQARRWKEDRVVTVQVSVDGGEPVDARLSEITPSGAVRMVGVGDPPYRREPLVV